jgi:hypothetical protein
MRIGISRVVFPTVVRAPCRAALGAPQGAPLDVPQRLMASA